MTTKLGQFIETARRRQGLSPQAVAKELGYVNLDKGARRVLALEHEGRGDADLLRRVVEQLGLDPAMVDELAAADRRQREQEFEQWAVEPQPITMLLQAAGLWFEVPLPPDVSEPEAAEQYAVEYARQHHVRVALILSRRRSLWLSPDGARRHTEATLDRPNVPFNTLR